MQVQMEANSQYYFNIKNCLAAYQLPELILELAIYYIYNTTLVPSYEL